jgi:hypothetical protein
MVGVVGAGYAGLGIARALQQAGIAFEVLERDSDLGGNWLRGVYERTHIISSRDTTGYAEFPMPSDYPDFPSRAQVLDYLRAYADHFGLRRHIRFNTEVVRADPRGRAGLDGWRVGLADGESHEYEALVVCNGHHWDRRYPDYPGRFDGHTLHSKDYWNSQDFARGPVLVVGAGNSGCDIAVEAARAGHETYISMRRGYHFLPKTLFGIPSAELEIPWVPLWLQRAWISLALRLTVGSNERYGLPQADHRLFEHHPIVNSELLYEIRHGEVRPLPDIERLDGDRVWFKDGSSLQPGTIVWATGFNISFPFLDQACLDYHGGAPRLIASMIPPGTANIYLFGLLQPRGGAGPLISAGAELVTDLIAAQSRLDHPVGDELRRFNAPSSRLLVGVHETMVRIKIARFLLRHVITPRRRRTAVAQPSGESA